MLLQQEGCTYREILCLRDALGSAFPCDQAVAAHSVVECIRPIYDLKYGLKLVVAVGAAAYDAQHQIELGRGRPRTGEHGVQRTLQPF